MTPSRGALRKEVRLGYIRLAAGNIASQLFYASHAYTLGSSGGEYKIKKARRLSYVHRYGGHRILSPESGIYPFSDSIKRRQRKICAAFFHKKPPPRRGLFIYSAIIS